jgi:hypothetical protein
MRAALLCLVLAGCYSPDARNCTVTCAAANDCINGQVCGSDHFCAAPDIAGHCSAVDAAVRPADARHDAPADSDEGKDKVTLTLMIMGHGTVAVDSITSCSGNCMVKVPAGVMRTLTATPDDPDKPLQMWMNACSGAAPTCTLTPMADLQIGAKFP